MKVKAHIMVSKGYDVAITASQWRSELEQQCEEHNQQFHAPGFEDNPERSSEYLKHDRDKAVVTVEFEVPDSVFKREPPIKVDGVVISTNPAEVPR